MLIGKIDVLWCSPIPSNEAYISHSDTNLPSGDVSLPKLIEVNGTWLPCLDSSVFKLWYNAWQDCLPSVIRSSIA